MIWFLPIPLVKNVTISTCKLQDRQQHHSVVDRFICLTASLLATSFSCQARENLFNSQGCIFNVKYLFKENYSYWHKSNETKFMPWIKAFEHPTAVCLSKSFRVERDPSEQRSDDSRSHQRVWPLLHLKNTLNNGRKDMWVFRRWATQKLLQAGFIRLGAGVGEVGWRGPSISCFYLSAQRWWGPACASNPDESKLMSRHLPQSVNTLLCPAWMPCRPCMQVYWWQHPAIINDASDCASPATNTMVC